jgi:hypothetical protein
MATGMKRLSNVMGKNFRSDSRKTTHAMVAMCSRLETYTWKFDGRPYRVLEDRIMIPDGCLIELSHEIAHIIEMNDDRRIVMDDMGFASLSNQGKTHKYWLPALAREAKVRAIEMVMVGENVTFDPMKMGTFNPLNNKGWHKAIHLAKDANPSKFATDDDVIDWVEQIQRTTIKNWDMDRINSVWAQKVEYIENHFAANARMAA